jgi:tetratricopeptide (TPR) repeat protein
MGENTGVSMRSFYLALLAGLLLLTGCDKSGPTTDAEEERNPLVNSGQEYMEQGEYDEAIAVFKKALDDNPMMARPHLDLAVIYQQYKINYIHAIYHYDRYLELRPNSEKADMINEQKLKVAKELANTLINNSPEVKQVIQERNTLVQQNNELKRQLSVALRNQKTTTTTAAKKTTTTKPEPVVTTKPAPEPVAKPAATTTASAPKHQIYHVVSGDTLTKIATKFYNDSGKWDIIFEANRDSMKSAGDLRVGQTLVIPGIGN